MKFLFKAIFTAILFFSLNFNLSHAQYTGAEVQEFSTPVKAPDFQLKKLGGGNVSLKELKGKIVILNFFTTW